MNYNKKAAAILTKVFKASRLDVEVTAEMLRLVIGEQEKEKQRCPYIMGKIKEMLSGAGFNCERKQLNMVSSNERDLVLAGRIKTIVSSMYNLLAPKNGEYHNLNDMIGLMILCEDTATCYDINSLLKTKLAENGAKVISEKDLIANPKKNGYQSIHLHVEDSLGFIFEVQIKSYKMFAFSQTGDCKHELYKKRLETSSLKEDEWIIFDSLREDYWF